jgi:hypothetical protein
MSKIGSYKNTAFSESQKFLVLDPSTNSASLVLASELVAYITPQIGSVKAESTRLSAENTDYKVGEIIQTSGATVVGSLASIYLVVAGGSGDFPMLNGNDLLVIAGDDNLREQLISEVLGQGASLVSMEGGPTVEAAVTAAEVAILNRVIRVTSRTDMKAYDVPAEYQFSLEEGGRSGLFVVKTGSPPADTLEGVYVVLTNGNYAERIDKTALTAEMFGAVGDGVADDTSSWLAVKGFAKYIIGKKEAIYLFTNELLMEEDQEIFLNGSEFVFNHTGQKKCVELKSGCSFHGGKVSNLHTGAQSGDFQTPVQVGDSRTSFSIVNWKIENLVIENATPNGNGVAAWGNSSAGVIRNIEFPQTSTIGRPVILHWGSLGVLPVAQTFHVHDVVVENIICRGLSITGASDAAAVFLSAVYNVTVNNVYCFDLPEGDIVRVYAGDYGYQYAQTTNERVLAGQGIDIKNIFGKGQKAVQVAMFNPSGDVSQVWPGSIEVSHVGAIGYGSINTLSNGIDVSNSIGVRVHDCDIQDFYANFFVGAGASHLSFKDNKSKNPVAKGFDCRFDSSNIKIKDNDFEGSPDFDVFLGTCQHILLSGNTYNSPAATNNVKFDAGANAPVDVKILNDLSEDVSAAGPAFSFGGSGDDKLCTLFSGVTVLNVPSNGITSGQIFVPYSRSSARASGVENVRCYFTQPPLTGAWARGDIIDNSTPAAGGNAGWICTTAGSPGTWKAFGTIVA